MKYMTSVLHSQSHLKVAVLPGLLLILTMLLPNLGVSGPIVATAATPASITVSPGSGVPNSPLAINGSNFISNSQVTVQFTQMVGGQSKATPLALIILPSGTFGFALSTAVPLSAQPGPATITASDAQGDSTSIAFTVNQAALTLSPSTVLPLGTVTASGANFAANEVVSVTVNSAVFTVTASAAGSFSSVFAAPAGTGIYPVTATGMSTGFQASATLTVQSTSPTSTSTAVPPTATSTNTPLPTSTGTPLPTATNTPVPPATSTPLPTATPTPCSGRGNSCAAHLCPRGKHAVHGICVRNASRAKVIVKAHAKAKVIVKVVVVRHPPIRRHR